MRLKMSIKGNGIFQTKVFQKIMLEIESLLHHFSLTRVKTGCNVCKQWLTLIVVNLIQKYITVLFMIIHESPRKNP
jgi:hypothetical protein